MRFSFGLSLALMSAAGPATAATLMVGSGETYTDVQSALDAATAGDIVLVTPGTYNVSALDPPSGVSLIAQDGPLTTKLYANGGGQAIFVRNVSSVRIEGFDIYAQAGVGPLTNGLVYIENSTDIYLGNCFVHDASDDGDVIKLNNTQDLVIENCVIWNPSERVSSPGTYQECIDIRGSGDARITLRGSWLFHVGSQGDYLIYAKGGTTDLLWENNVFGPSAGSGWGNVPVETGHLGATDPTQYESENFVVRNNLFVGLQGSAAFAFAGPNVALLYNNVFYANQNVSRALIEISANPALAGGPALGIRSYNNIFYNNGTKQIYRVRDAQSGQNLIRDYNVYESGAAGVDLSLASELGSTTIADPMFAAAAVPAFNAAVGTEQIAAILDGFRITSASPARDAGVNVWDVTSGAHPNAIARMADRQDAFAGQRPAGASWDAGLHQYAALPAADGGVSGDGAASDGAASDGAASDGGPVAAGDAAVSGGDGGKGSGLTGGCNCRLGSSWMAALFVGLMFSLRVRRRVPSRLNQGR